MKNYVRAKRLNVCGAPVFLHWSVLVVMGGCLSMAVSDPIVAIVAAVSYFSVILIHEWGHAFVASRLGYAIDSIPMLWRDLLGRKKRPGNRSRFKVVK
jgi:hypothetical protein